MAEKKKREKIDTCHFPVHDCTQEQNVSILCFASIVRQCKWPSRSNKIVEIQKFCNHGNVTSHFSSLLTELWKTSLGYPRGFAPHYCLNRYVYAKNNKNNNNWYKPAHYLGLRELVHHLATNLHIFAVLFDFQGDINNVNRLFFLCSVRLKRERKHINANLNLLRSKRKTIQNGIWHKLTGM